MAKLQSLCTVYDSIFEMSIDNHLFMLTELIVWDSTYIDTAPWFFSYMCNCVNENLNPFNIN